MVNPALSHPDIARLFRAVHVLCWPWLFWQLRQLIRWGLETGNTTVLISVSRWGRLQVRYAGRPAPPRPDYRPLSDYIDQPTHIPDACLARLDAWPPLAQAGRVLAIVKPHPPGLKPAAAAPFCDTS
ncbi:hypothetical protein [Hyphomonas sp.]|uniref:hypothetical protein n=1 Tax=Hyphomonas sp. TaxID=87 RepID=UPI00391C1997